MAAVSLTTPSNPTAGAPTIYPGWSLQETTESKVQQLMASKFTEIVADYHQRKERQTADDLRTGPWYSNHYAAALRENDHPNLRFFVQKNHFYHGHPPIGFNHPIDRRSLSGKAVASYQIQANFSPTIALNTIRSGQASLIDCGIAVELAMYETVREILGDDRFNRIFKDKLSFHHNMANTTLHSMGFFKEVSSKTPKLGDIVYFANIPFYVTRHPNGESKGYNALCISPEGVQEKKYIAFGTSAEGKTESEMYDLLIEECNEQPINPSLVFGKKLADRFIAEAKEINAICVQQTGQKIADVQVSRADFDTARKSLPTVGLQSLILRLDVATIKKYLKST